MTDADFQLIALRDPRLAVHAMSGMSAWLWSADASRVIWSNAAAAKTFGARNAAILASKPIGPADPHRRQVAQLAARLPEDGAMRLERLRGFGAPLGRLMTCACSRFSLNDGCSGVLVIAADQTGRMLSADERIASLLESLSIPALAFTRDGSLVGTNDAAKMFATRLNSLAAHDAQRETALGEGTATIDLDFGYASLHRVGTGADVRLIAVTEAIIPEHLSSAPVAPNVEQEPAAVDYKDLVSDAHAEGASAPDAAYLDQPIDLFESVFDNAPPERSATPTDETREDSLTTATDNATAHAAPAEIIANASAHEPITEKAKPDEHAAVDEPVAEKAPEPARAPILAATSHSASDVSSTLSQMDGPLHARKHPLRFMWQMDEHGRFSLGSDEFTRLIGTRTAAAFGRLWSEIADTLALDPDGKVAAAIATRDTWSGIVVNWPADNSGTRLPVELSGLPLFDRDRNFIGYRGFGVCRHVEELARLAAQRRDEVLYSSPPSAKPVEHHEDAATSRTDTQKHAQPASTTPTNSADLAPSVEPPQNVVPFRAANETKPPVLTVGESNAFDELARRLSATLERANDDTPPAASSHATDATITDDKVNDDLFEPLALQTPPAFLQPEAAPLRAASAQDVQLLDRLPLGILVYRLDKLIYANRAFLERTGFANLHALSDAGGLDALYVEPVEENGSSTSGEGTPVIMATTKAAHQHDAQTPINARLFAISWDDEPALALMFSGDVSSTPPLPVVAPVIAAANNVEPAIDHSHAEELSTILDTTTEGIVMFDGLGRIVSCNRSAEALFSRDGDDIAKLNLIDLFAPESQKTALDYLESVKSTAVASLLDHGREMLGRARDGGAIPLSMTMGRTRPDSSRFFAVFRDMSQVKRTESDLLQAKRQVERATTAKAEVLGRISHEVRMPLNAIIGFADVMIEERFGPLGNERYVEYMKDIRASGQRVMTIVDDLLDLSRIESGKLELAFANQDLNNLVEQCVAVMQPQANRERIIIRTSLAHALPSVKADARALRQIAMNLIGSSIHLANAGGQVIVSTATTDFGDIVLRVRDTGTGMNDNEIAAAMAPFRTPAANDSLPPDNSGVSLSLTKALVEANRAKFNIKTAPHSGTLIEVVFSHASAIA